MVTGAASGIGRAAALAFARAGARVAVLDVQEQAGAETVALIEREGGAGEFMHCDVSDFRSVQAAVDGCVSRLGRLDFALNNAGIAGPPGPLAQYAPDDFRRVIDVNLTGVFLCMRAQLPVMLEQGAGAVVNTSSTLGVVTWPGSGAYTAAKHGVLGLTKAAAWEVGEHGIRVNAICPASTQTPLLTEGSWAVRPGTPEFDQLASLIPIGRVAQPEEIANVAVWLCSDEASFVTGHGLLIDGAYTAA
jgi:NAD(P)-dependent dehydrogenase (short-subunit alcohol dehydrogenase family)